LRELLLAPTLSDGFGDFGTVRLGDLHQPAALRFVEVPTGSGATSRLCLPVSRPVILVS
jgi:hypothetical protein